MKREDNGFPIYRIWGIWNQKDYKKNGTETQTMCEHELTGLEMKELLNKFKTDIELKYDDVEWIDVGIKFIECETWCLKWFSHFTYNKFDTDSDAINSLNDFIERKKKLNIQNGHNAEERNYNSNKPFYCFMGATDLWRQEVCNCEHCKKGEWTIINH